MSVIRKFQNFEKMKILTIDSADIQQVDELLCKSVFEINDRPPSMISLKKGRLVFLLKLIFKIRFLDKFLIEKDNSQDQRYSLFNLRCENIIYNMSPHVKLVAFFRVHSQ